MSPVIKAALFRRIDRLELAVCLALNRICRLGSVESVFSVVSRLGDGVFWYITLMLLPLFYGRVGLAAALHMTAVGLVAWGVYRLLKLGLIRVRPFMNAPGFRSNTAPLDDHSFPSGHTLHAVSFTLIGAHYVADLVWVLAPFTALVAASRVVLGLHYPTDVLAGGAIGMVLALASFSVLRLVFGVG